MKRWHFEILAGWLSIAGWILINIAFIKFDSDLSPYCNANDLCFDLEAIGNAMCALPAMYFLMVGRVPLIGKLGISLYAAGHAFNMVQEILDIADRSLLQVIAYVVVCIITILYVANQRNA